MPRHGSPPPDDIAALFAAIRAELESHEFANLDEAQAHLSRLMTGHNAAPQADLGGLTPDELHQVLNGDWRGTAPLRLARDLPLDDLDAAVWFQVARLLMQLIHRDGPLKATTAGNLPRTVVAMFLAKFVSAERQEGMGATGVGALKERDLSVLHLPRVLLEVSDLVRRRKGRFVLTRQGRALLPDQQAGELFARLFEGCFRKLNLAYLDRAPEAPVFQHLMPYALVRLRNLAVDWIPARRVADDALHPGVRSAIPVPSPLWDPVAVMVGSRLLGPLEQFGLVERRAVPQGPMEYLAADVRKTTLYDQFLTDGRLRVER